MKLNISYAKIQKLVAAYLAEDVTIVEIGSPKAEELNIKLKIERFILNVATTTCRVKVLTNNTDILEIKILEYPVFHKYAFKIASIFLPEKLHEGISYDSSEDIIRIDSTELIQHYSPEIALTIKPSFSKAITDHSGLELHCSI